jgi:hypothetical protein
MFKKLNKKIIRQNHWARPEMAVTFRAEIMPGRSHAERTYRIREILPNGRVVLYDFDGEHRESSFEKINFKREEKNQNS